jgi:tRNA threonylcarbamoyladenosine biosynthesis protein TsaE
VSEVVVRTASADATRALGRRLGPLLRAGDIVALTGDLGAGKTVLAQGIADGAGASGYKASPTFTFIREYPGPVRVYHVDLYRLDHPRELDDLGLEEILDGLGIVIIEWAEKMRHLLPEDHLGVTIRFLDAADAREIRFDPVGARYARIVKEMTRAHAEQTEARKRGSAKTERT